MMLAPLSSVSSVYCIMVAMTVTVYMYVLTATHRTLAIALSILPCVCCVAVQHSAAAVQTLVSSRLVVRAVLAVTRIARCAVVMYSAARMARSLMSPCPIHWHIPAVVATIAAAARAFVA